MITPDDVKFHTPPGADHHWAETTHIAFQVPEHDLNCAIYLVAKAGIGVIVCEVIVFNTLSLDRREVLYFDSEHHLPVPADFSDYTLPNGFSLKAVNPPRDYRVDYVGTDDTEFHLDITGLMEPYDIHDPAMCPTAVPISDEERVRRAGFGAAYTAHYDMSVRIRGTLRVHGRTFDVDCVDTMDHSWGPRPTRNLGMMGWQHAHFGPDYGMHAIWLFDAPTDDRPLWEVETFHLGHGYVVDHGEVFGLKSGTMTARREGSLPVQYTVEVVDRADRTHTFTGDARSAHNWVCYQALQINYVLCEWRSGSGEVGSGIHQESFPLNLMARHPSSPARQRLAAGAALVAGS